MRTYTVEYAATVDAYSPEEAAEAFRQTVAGDAGCNYLVRVVDSEFGPDYVTPLTAEELVDEPPARHRPPESVDRDTHDAPHLDSTATMCADVTVYRMTDVRDDRTLVKYWHVSVKHSNRRNPDGEIVTADYPAWSAQTPAGMFAAQAAAALVERTLTR